MGGVLKRQCNFEGSTQTSEGPSQSKIGRFETGQIRCEDDVSIKSIWSDEHNSSNEEGQQPSDWKSFVKSLSGNTDEGLNTIEKPTNGIQDDSNKRDAKEEDVYEVHEFPLSSQNSSRW